MAGFSENFIESFLKSAAEESARRQKTQNTTCPDAPWNSKLRPSNSIGSALNLNNMTTHMAINAEMGMPTSRAAKCSAILE
jgi:hypothetical protein